MAAIRGAGRRRGRRCAATRATIATVEALVRRAVDAFGGLDIFYANAGITGSACWAAISTPPPRIWAETLRVNLIGPFLAVKYAAPEIEKRGGGAILATASVAGLRSGAGPAPYSASKAGVINLVQTAAQQLAGTGVRVNAICPGLIETGMTKFAYDQARAGGQGRPRSARSTRLQRGGEPEEIAAVGAVPRLGRRRATSTGRRWWSTAGCPRRTPTVAARRARARPGERGSDRPRRDAGRRSSGATAGWRRRSPRTGCRGAPPMAGVSAALAFTAARGMWRTTCAPLRSAQISFVGPLDGTVSASAAMLRRGRSASFVDAQVDGTDGKLGLRATFLFAADRESAMDHQDAAPPADLPDPADMPEMPKPPASRRSSTISSIA